jgi:ankyrin repeat protein
MKQSLFAIVCISLIFSVFGCADSTDKDARLIKAAKDGDLPAIQTALAGGDDINGRDKSGATALMWAANGGHAEVVKLLLEKGADVNVKRIGDGITALAVAAQNGHTELVNLLLEKGAEVNAKSSTGVTALILASQNGHTDVVKSLLAAKADINAKASVEGKDYTPLSVAKEMGRIQIIELLEKAGAKE